MAKNKPTKTVKKTPCGNQPRSRLMKAYESVIGVVAFGLYCKKGFCLLFSKSTVIQKVLNFLGYGEVNLRTVEDTLLGQG